MKKLAIIELITGLIAVGLILYWYDWKLLIIILLVMFAQNIKIRFEIKKAFEDIYLKILKQFQDFNE